MCMVNGSLREQCFWAFIFLNHNLSNRYQFNTSIKLLGKSKTTVSYSSVYMLAHAMPINRAIPMNKRHHDP